MIRVFVRKSTDVAYFTRDEALEIDGVREGGPGWWLRGVGDARDERDVARVLETTPRASVVGYDLVVAAPRPVSVLLALDSASARDVVAAHRRSVAAALDYLEDHALVTRQRASGEERDEPGHWRRVVAYTHGLNRHGEPHLHDHVLVGALPRESSTVLDARALFAHARTADALYRTSLRYELGARTPWSAWRSFEGIEHVAGLDEGYRAIWSGRHRDRGEKLAWTRAETLHHWGEDLARFVSVGSVAMPRARRDALDEHRFAGAFEGQYAVARRHVVAAWANAAVFGHEPKELERRVDEIYPQLSLGRGVHERTVSLAEARMSSLVHHLGPRPLERAAFEQWRQRSQERSRDVSGDWSRERGGRSR